jgi:uncharacterized protein (DUF983 family)
LGVAKRRTQHDQFDEDPSEADVERFSDVTQKCPHCGTQLFDDVELCWQCGMAVSDKPERSPMSLIVVLVIVMLVIITFVFFKVW